MAIDPIFNDAEIAADALYVRQRNVLDTMLASERSLAKDWNQPDEDEAWLDLEKYSEFVRRYATDGETTHRYVDPAALLAEVAGAIERHWADELCAEKKDLVEDIAAFVRGYAEEHPTCTCAACSWVEGAPPRDGKWYLIETLLGHFAVVQWNAEEEEYETFAGEEFVRASILRHALLHVEG